MSTLFERLHILPVSSQVKEGLVEKCQENDCLMRGGCDWQDDPYLEEYPYEFARIEDMEVLRQTLGGGNWAIRQGFLYKDLAFIQQVNAGDEWWTLKKTDDGWLDFESWSFGSVAKDFHKFARAITSMHVATPEECKDLDYMRDYEELMLPPRCWQASDLPEGWQWAEYDDGSGSLSAPDGEKVCTFDKQTRSSPMPTAATTSTKSSRMQISKSRCQPSFQRTPRSTPSRSANRQTMRVMQSRRSMREGAWRGTRTKTGSDWDKLSQSERTAALGQIVPVRKGGRYPWQATSATNRASSSSTGCFGSGRTRAKTLCARPRASW